MKANLEGAGSKWQGPSQELPFVDYPTPEEPFEFYKVMKKEEEQKWIVLGLKLHHMRQH